MAEGSHPYPFRTRKLSPPAPMVLGGRLPGRVGRRRISLEKRAAIWRPSSRFRRPVHVVHVCRPFALVSVGSTAMAPPRSPGGNRRGDSRPDRGRRSGAPPSGSAGGRSGGRTQGQGGGGKPAPPRRRSPRRGDAGASASWRPVRTAGPAAASRTGGRSGGGSSSRVVRQGRGMRVAPAPVEARRSGQGQADRSARRRPADSSCRVARRQLVGPAGRPGRRPAAAATTRGGRSPSTAQAPVGRGGSAGRRRAPGGRPARARA